MNKRKAFTMLELLLVVAILGIVAAVSIPQYSKEAQKAIDEAKRARFMAAYNNAVSTAKLHIALVKTSGGTKKFAYISNPDYSWNNGNHPKNILDLASLGSPKSARSWCNLKGCWDVISVAFNENTNELTVFSAGGNLEPRKYTIGNNDMDDPIKKWEEIKNATWTWNHP